MSILGMLAARHRALQLGVFIAGLIATIQLTLDGVDLSLLIGERLASVVNEHRPTMPILLLRNLAIQNLGRLSSDRGVDQCRPWCPDRKWNRREPRRL